MAESGKQHRSFSMSPTPLPKSFTVRSLRHGRLRFYIHCAADYTDELILLDPEARECTARFLHQQMVGKQISLEEMLTWDDRLLLHIARKWANTSLAHKNLLAKDVKSFEAFKQALNEYLTEQSLMETVDTVNGITSGLDFIRDSILPVIDANTLSAMKSAMLPPISYTAIDAISKAMMPNFSDTAFVAMKSAMLPPINYAAIDAIRSAVLPPISDTAFAAISTAMTPNISDTMLSSVSAMLSTISNTALSSLTDNINSSLTSGFSALEAMVPDMTIVTQQIAETISSLVDAMNASAWNSVSDIVQQMNRFGSFVTPELFSWLDQIAEGTGSSDDFDLATLQGRAGLQPDSARISSPSTDTSDDKLQPLLSMMNQLLAVQLQRQASEDSKKWTRSEKQNCIMIIQNCIVILLTIAALVLAIDAKNPSDSHAPSPGNAPIATPVASPSASQPAKPPKVDGLN